MTREETTNIINKLNSLNLCLMINSDIDIYVCSLIFRDYASDIAYYFSGINV